MAVELRVRELLDRGLDEHRAGRLREAEAAYQQLLAIRPDHPDALHLVGVVCNQWGNQDRAAELIEKAIGLLAQFRIPQVMLFLHPRSTTVGETHGL